MFEQEKPKSYLQELDQWTQTNVIDALFNSDPIEGDWSELVAQVKKAIRTKVLESYHNGQAAAGGTKSQPGSIRPRRQFPK
jgi:hypothetical protein